MKVLVVISGVIDKEPDFVARLKEKPAEEIAQDLVEEEVELTASFHDIEPEVEAS